MWGLTGSWIKGKDQKERDWDRDGGVEYILLTRSSGSWSFSRGDTDISHTQINENVENVLGLKKYMLVSLEAKSRDVAHFQRVG